MKSITHALTCLLLMLSSTLYTADVPEAYIVGKPLTHENLSVYPVYKRSIQLDTSKLLTLQEAMDQKLVTVHETGSVNQLAISVLGDTPVYIQAGDVVKGGKQDRVIAYDMIVRKESGKMALTTFCVEQGRWQKRGTEDANAFNSCNNYVVGNKLKSAVRDQALQSKHMPQVQHNVEPEEAGGTSIRNQQQEIVQSNDFNAINISGERSSGQSAVWAQVKEQQQGLYQNSKLSQNDLDSDSSLQLTMEHEKTIEAIAGYEEHFSKLPQQDQQIVGYAFAINGTLNSAEIYASNDLFKRMWPKLLRASATEALSLKSTVDFKSIPVSDDVQIWVNRPSTYEEKASQTAGDCENKIYINNTERCYDSYHREHLQNGLLHRTLLK